MKDLLAEKSVCKSHGIGHACAVAILAKKALECHPGGALSDTERLAVRLAALLHDADDRKLFPQNDDHQNARAVLSACVGPEVAARVVTMIGLVSSSVNGDSAPEGVRPHMLYPRHADRLTAIGWEGVYRCWVYTQGVGRPLYTPDTPRAKDERDLWENVATPARYAAYRGGSESMLDHYYDKLLRIADPLVASENPFIRGVALERRQPMVDLALAFGRDGRLPEELLRQSASYGEREVDDSLVDLV